MNDSNYYPPTTTREVTRRLWSLSLFHCLYVSLFVCVCVCVCVCACQPNADNAKSYAACQKFCYADVYQIFFYYLLPFPVLGMILHQTNYKSRSKLPLVTYYFDLNQFNFDFSLVNHLQRTYGQQLRYDTTPCCLLRQSKYFSSSDHFETARRNEQSVECFQQED